MPSITTLKEKLATPTLHLALLTLATGGVWLLIWLYKHQDTLMQETGQRFSSSVLIIWMAVCFGLGAFLRPYSMPQIDEMNYIHSPVVMIAITGILSIALMVLYIVWAFKARVALQNYALTQFQLELKMNLFYTFAFSIYYVNYCINALPDALAKQQILRAHLQQQPAMQAAPGTTSEGSQQP